MMNLNLTQDQVAQRVGKSRSHITNMLGLLTLPEEVKNLVSENKISTIQKNKMILLAKQ